MCECNDICSCGSLISTSKGQTGATGPQGPAGANGADGVLDWTQYDLSCWESEGIIGIEATNNEISQDFIDTFCEIYQAVNTAPIATNDYVSTDKEQTVYISVTNNDMYFPDATVTISIAPSNGVATVEPDGKTIKYVPDGGFIGVDDFEYTLTDTNAATDTAVVTVTVNDVLNEAAVETICLDQLVALMQSNEYWDLGLPKGTKLMISNENIDDFDFSGMNPGMGKPNTKWYKWAICNGNNGTDSDFTNRNLRGWDQTDTGVSDEAGYQAGSDADITLTIDNLPAHQHTAGFFAPEWGQDSGDTAFNNFNDSNFIPGLTDKTRDASDIQNTHQNDGVGAGDVDYYQYGYNTGDGTDNFGVAPVIPGSPDPIPHVNAYTTVIVVQKVTNTI